MERRVVVTGMGAVTPLGIGVQQTWQGMCSGRSGITGITLFDASAFASQVAGEVKDFDPAAWIEPREVRHTDRFVQLAIAAASMAVDDSALDLDGIDRNLGETQLVRLNAMSQSGAQIAGYFGVRGLPALIVVDGEGLASLRQVGRIRRDDVLQEVHRLVHDS